MTQLDKDINRQGSQTEVSRARQRKMKREGTSSASAGVEAGTKQQAPKRQRASRRTGPSVREKLVTAQINAPGSSIQSIQGKLSSRLDKVKRSAKVNQTIKKGLLTGAVLGTQHSRRKSESQRGETHHEATSSSETQRKSGSDDSFIPRKSRRVFDARSETTPPVMVRGGMGGMAFGRVASSRIHKQKSLKRRFDVPLKMQGAEVRLPSIPLIHFGWRAVSLLMVLMMGASLFLLWKTPAFQIKAVEAEGLKRLTVADLNTVMGTLGASVFSINPQGLEKILVQAFPELEKISVSVNLPASVKVAVVEREPIISWNQNGNEIWLDAQGVSFPPRGNPENALVRVDGHGTPPSLISTPAEEDLQYLPAGMPSAPPTTSQYIRLSPDLVSAILALGANMPADTLLVYDSEHGLGWTDPKGWEVYFGAQDQDMEMKLLVYQALVERLESKGIQPALISVEYVHAPYYRMER